MRQGRTADDAGMTATTVHGTFDGLLAAFRRDAREPVFNLDRAKLPSCDIGADRVPTIAEGTLRKSEMLVEAHPDVSKLVWRYDRWHHHVDYSPFQKNRLKPVVDLTKLKKVNDYAMKLVVRTRD